MLDRTLRWAFRRGLRDGVAGGSGTWLVIAVAAGLWQLARRPPKSKAVRFQIRPGERYTILCSDEPVAR